VGSYLSTAIANTLQASLKGKSDASNDATNQGAAIATADLQKDIENRLGTVVKGMVQGLETRGDFWTLTRHYDPDDPKVHHDLYTYTILKTISTKTLQDQASDYLKANKDEIAGLMHKQAADVAKVSQDQMDWQHTQFTGNTKPEQKADVDAADEAVSEALDKPDNKSADASDASDNSDNSEDVEK
jgi:hypothetical protein